MTEQHPLDSLWETSSGLPLDGAKVTVVDMAFGFNDFFAGKVCANFKFLNDEDGQTYDQSFTVGTQGRASANGSELLDAPKRINNQSNFGRLIHAAMDLIPHPGETLGSPFVAGNWVGSRWELGTIEREVPVDINNPQGEKKKSRPLTFIAFLGKGAVTPGAGTSSSSAGQQAAGNNGHGEEFDKLVAFAGGYTTHDDFLEAVLAQFPDVEKNAELRKAVYMDKPGSVWAVAKGA